jgi:hypothetical protein
MKVTIVVDANPMIATLLGGISRSVFFERRFRFYTTDYTMNEIHKYILTLQKSRE